MPTRRPLATSISATPDADLPRGTTRTTNGGCRTILRIEGALYAKRFKPDQPLRAVVEWIEEIRVRARIGAPMVVAAVDPDDTFRKDAQTYLAAVTGMPSYRSRADDIALWVRVFGDRPRASIRTVEIRTQLTKWRATYAANTVNHRLTALKQMWSVLDEGLEPRPSNPVAGIQKERDTSMDRPARALPPAVIRVLFAHMRPSPTKARLQLMAWTGWPQQQIADIDREKDVNWHDRSVFLGRNKGKGKRGEWIPLLPRGWAAFRIFVRWRAWGSFSTDSLRKSLRLAATKVQQDPAVPADLRAQVTDITPYDLRHSFLTLVGLTTTDDRVTAFLGLHSDVRMVARYTKAATNPRVADGLAAVTRTLRLVPRLVPKPTPKLPLGHLQLPPRRKGE